MKLSCALLVQSLVLALAAGCRTPATPLAIEGEGPLLIALGTVQDGGLPHASCGCERCELARQDSTRRRFVSGLAIRLPDEDQNWLIDATPNLPYQLEILRIWDDDARDDVDHAPIDGVFLTHAHVGHYLGLANLGTEAVNTSDVAVYATHRTGDFLRNNAPWCQLVGEDNVELQLLRPKRTVQIADRFRVTPFLVPYHGDCSDTVGFRIEGRRSTVLYVPDTVGWDQWKTPLTERLQGVDVALLDGSFYSLDDIPGRSRDEVGHPLITETMDLLQPLVAQGLIVYFTHMHHMNPILGPGTEVADEVRRRGFRILDEGWTLDL